MEFITNSPSHLLGRCACIISLFFEDVLMTFQGRTLNPKGRHMCDHRPQVRREVEESKMLHEKACISDMACNGLQLCRSQLPVRLLGWLFHSWAKIADHAPPSIPRVAHELAWHSRNQTPPTNRFDRKLHSPPMRRIFLLQLIADCIHRTRLQSRQPCHDWQVHRRMVTRAISQQTAVHERTLLQSPLASWYLKRELDVSSRSKSDTLCILSTQVSSMPTLQGPSRDANSPIQA